MLSLGCCMDFSLVVVSRGCSSCGVQASHCGGFSCCRAQALGAWLSSCGLGASVTQGMWNLQHVEFPWTRDGTHVPCIGSQSPSHWTTRDVLPVF